MYFWLSISFSCALLSPVVFMTNPLQVIVTLRMKGDQIYILFFLSSGIGAHSPAGEMLPWVLLCETSLCVQREILQGTSIRDFISNVFAHKKERKIAKSQNLNCVGETKTPQGFYSKKIERKISGIKCHCRGGRLLHKQPKTSIISCI